MKTILAAAVLLSGCSSIPIVGNFYSPGPDKTGKAVQQYCNRVSSGLRDAFRDSVNAHAQPHEVYVWCYGNDPPWLDSERWDAWLEETEGPKIIPMD